MPKCKYHEVCGLDALENTEEELCILHSQISTKDNNEFNEAFEAHRKKNRCNFRFLYFPEKADFNGATFNEGVDFSYAKFAKRAGFVEAKFTERANFASAKFTGGVDFLGTKFTKGADFKGATFNEEADFNGATFAKEAIFFRATFRARTIFAPIQPVQRKDKTLQIFSEADVDFSRVIVEPPDVLTLRDADLKKCRFQHTDLRKVEITNADWPEIIWPKKMPKGFGWLRTKRIGVYDEASLPKGETRSLPHIERVYRELKQNYEDRRDFDRAGDFHYGEKQMRRKNPEIPLGRRFLLWLYWFVSGYGERCLRPVVWATVLLFTSALGYYRWGLQPKGSSSRLICSGFRDSAEYLFYSFRVMTFLKPEDLVPLGYARYVNAFESLVGPLLIGFFALALRQRLKR